MNRREAGLADKVPVKKGISPNPAIMPGRANPFGSKLSGLEHHPIRLNHLIG